MTIKNISKSFNNNLIFKNLNLSLNDGEITFIMGKSGVGKTTLLRIIAGLDTDYSGEIDYTGKLAYVFQEPRLFPQLTVLENIKVVNESPTIDPTFLLSVVELSGC